MEGTPEAVDTNSMKEEIETIAEGVKVTDFHCWSLSKGQYALSAKIQCNAEGMKILKEATKVVNNYGIKRATL